ncbi:hypothetical protein DVK05_09805 [Halorubrum sp. Atlit-8R]|nr:hypothetical protein DVK05_09805 [Halorubrum sp. Atlit-8R]
MSAGRRRSRPSQVPLRSPPRRRHARPLRGTRCPRRRLQARSRQQRRGRLVSRRAQQSGARQSAAGCRPSRRGSSSPRHRSPPTSTSGAQGRGSRAER